MKFLYILFFTLFSINSYSQVTIGWGDPANKNALLELKENKDGTSSKGLLYPRVSLVTVSSPAPMTDHVEGMVVYNIATSDDSVDELDKVSPGNYYNDGYKWIRVSDSEAAIWYNSKDQTAAKNVSDDIYHTGSVTIGSTTNTPSAELEVVSSDKGVLIPLLTTVERDAIANPVNGLMLFNTTTNCINYYNSKDEKWLNLCGGYDPAVISINCENSQGPSSDLTQKTALNTTNTYALNLTVITSGTYDIVATSGNGYIFTKTGLFPTTGNFDVVLQGQGAPINSGTDAISIELNATKVDLDCTLPPVKVNPETIDYTIIPANCAVFGTYYESKTLNNTHYLEIEINVTNPGILNLDTNAENGISFSSGSLTLGLGVQKIKLYGYGTPEKAGIFTGIQATDPQGNTYNPTIKVITDKGSYDNPVNRCQEILDADKTMPSGYYWLKDTSSNKFMTYCLMENESEAWTLVKSLSERQIIVVDKTQNESIATQPSRNIVTTQTGVFNEYAFSLPSNVVNNIGNSASSTRLFKFSIKEKGHTTATGATMSDVESSTVSIDDDVWAPENYWNVTILSGNPATGNFISTANNNTTEGKLFGKAFSKPSNTSSDYFFDGIKFRTNPPGMYSQANFFTGFYGALGYVATNNTTNNVTYTYQGRGDSSDGKTFTYNKYYINDLFGVYLNSESQINHHIGTCANSTDDYGGASFCNYGWANWRPHNLNKRPDGNYEGRIVQYWVK